MNEVYIKTKAKLEEVIAGCERNAVIIKESRARLQGVIRDMQKLNAEQKARRHK